MGPSTGTRMRGWGVGATWGPRSPYSWPARTATFRACLRREGRGHLSRAGRGRLEKHSDFSPMDCTEGFGAWGTGPAAQDGVAEHPPFWKHETSSRRCPFHSQGWGGALVAQGKGSGISRLPCLTQSRPRSQRQGREGGREGVESAGESPGDLHPIIFTSWSSELPSEAPAGVKGGVPLGRVRVGDRPLQNCAGCFVWGFCSFPRRPGRDVGGGRQFCILSFCPLFDRVRFACFFLLGCWRTAPPRPLPRLSEN